MYGNIAGADAHHTASGNTSWTALEDDIKTANLHLATRALDAMFEAEFIGVRTGGASQLESWPRTGAAVAAAGLLPTETPEAVNVAAYELADMIRLNPTAWSQVYQPGQMLKRKKTGPLEKEFFAPGETTGGVIGLPQVPMIRGWLYGLLKITSTSRRSIAVMVV